MAASTSSLYTMFGYLATVLVAVCIKADQPPKSLLTAMCNPAYVPDFNMDTAQLKIVNDRANLTLALYMQSEECYQCDLKQVFNISTNCTVLVDTRWPVRLEIHSLSNNTTALSSCRESSNTHLFLEYGEYAIFIQHILPNKSGLGNASIDCRFVSMNSPADNNIPIYVALGVAFFLAVVWTILKRLYSQGYLHRIACFWSPESIMSQDFGTPTSINPTEEVKTAGEELKNKVVTKERLRSLDTFRGISIVVMIFVNYRGGGYWFFKHSKWNGLTVADLVFPWFVFIMGTAMMLSFQGQLRRGTPKPTMWWRIVRRSIILFGLGLLINSGGPSDGIDLSRFRIPGVLQRFALTYFIVASVHLLFARLNDSNAYGRWASVRDIIEFWPEWVFHLSLVAIHLAFTFGLDVPGCPKGYLGPGGYADHDQYINCTGGAAGYIDRKIFGDNHIYQSPTCKDMYNTVVPYDPEGMLGTLTACFLCFLGLQAGKILFIHKDWVQRWSRFLGWGIFLGLIAGVLCKFSKNDGWIPVNKNLWSVSFVLSLAAMAFILLVICYLSIDVYKVWSGVPFYYPGMNSIVLYVGHELLSGRFPVSFDVVNTHAAQFPMNLWGTCFWVLVSYYLHYKGIYISV